MNKSLWTTAGLALLLGTTTGCGELVANLYEQIEAHLQQEASELALQQAELAMEAFDQLELSSIVELADDQFSTGGDAPSAPAFSPQSLLALAEGPVEDADGDGYGDAAVEVETYACDVTPCRISSVTATREIRTRNGEVIGSVTHQAAFQYYSSLVAALDGEDGDLNITPPGHAYVRADYTITRALPDAGVELAIGFGDSSVVTSGHRVWSTHPGEWYVRDELHETTGLPIREGGRYVSASRFERSFAVPVTTDTEGDSTRTLTFADGSTDSVRRNAAYEVTTGTLTGDWSHTGRAGFVGLGDFEIATNGTPLCRLDDEGAVNIERTFGHPETHATTPVTETVSLVQNGTVTTIDGELTLLDGSTLTKSLTRTQTLPADCDSRGKGVRAFDLKGTTYAGSTIDLQEVHNLGSVAFRGERTLPTGEVERIAGVASQGVMNLRVVRLDAAGRRVLASHIVLQPNGDGQGRLAAWREGHRLIRQIVILDGKVSLADETGLPVQMEKEVETVEYRNGDSPIK